MNTGTLTMAALDELQLDPSNPREEIDGDRLDELTASIQKHGILQPLLARPNPDNSGWLVIAGQRRLLAATQAGLTTVPIFIREANGDAPMLSLVENLQREELTPIEEAEAFKTAVDGGMTTADLAAAIGRSEQLVKDRIALLELPSVVQMKVATGELTLRAAAALPKLAVAGEAVVVKAAEMIVMNEAESWRDPVTAADIEDEPSTVLKDVLDQLGDDAPFVIAAGKGYRIDLERIHWPATVDGAELKSKVGQLPHYDPKTYKRVRDDAITFAGADVDAARAYGCLLEFDQGTYYAPSTWVTDPAWLADRLNEKLDKAIKAWDRKQKAAAGKATAAEPDVDAKERAKQERAEQRQQMLSARERNISLRTALFTELAAPAIDLENMRLVALLVAEYAADDLGRAGIRFVDEEAETVTTKKDGTISKVSYVKDTRGLSQLLRRRIEKAKTPEQIMGVLLGAMIASKFADAGAAPSSDRYRHVRGIESRYSTGDTDLLQLLEKVAEPVLPADVVLELREKRAASDAERLEEDTVDGADGDEDAEE